MEADEPAAFDIQLEWAGDEYQRSNDRPAASRDERRAPVPDAASAATAPAPTTPLLPALAVRLDDVLSAVASLAARVDALAGASQTSQSAMSNRLIEHLEATTAATSAQHEALDEYRRAAERSIAELRRATGATDKLVRTLAARLDEISNDVQLAAEAQPAPPADVDLDALRATIADAIAELEIPAPVVTPAPATSDTGGELAEELAAIRDEITQLKRRIGVRGRSSGATLDDHQLNAILERIDSRAAAPSPSPVWSDADFDRIVDSIVDRLAAVLEIVPDDDPPAASPATSLPPTSGSSRRGRAARA